MTWISKTTSQGLGVLGGLRHMPLYLRECKDLPRRN